MIIPGAKSRTVVQGRQAGVKKKNIRRKVKSISKNVTNFGEAFGHLMLVCSSGWATRYAQGLRTLIPFRTNK